jgi:membrane peptidoglycan carboxypeptidase
MVEQGWLKPQDRPTAYPKWKPFDADACNTTCGNDKPSGKIIKYVKQELLAMGIKQDEWTQGGLRITTTINKSVQQAAEEAVNRRDDNSPMHDLKSSYKPALVAVNPTNGRVLAYYGGPKGDGVGWDYAGPNYGKEWQLPRWRPAARLIVQDLYIARRAHGRLRLRHDVGRHAEEDRRRHDQQLQPYAARL